MRSLSLAVLFAVVLPRPEAHAAKPKAEEPAPAPQVTPAAGMLEGRWLDPSGSEPISLQVTGDALYFHARDDFQYDARIQLLPGIGRVRMVATILDTPRTTDAKGEVVHALFALEGDVLRLHVVGEEKAAVGDISMPTVSYRFERVAAAE